MSVENLLIAALLGFVEGLTEFLPVSSTAHVLLLGELLGFNSTGNTFQVLIQLGAILAIVTVYFDRLIRIATTLPTHADTRRFSAGVLIAFLPAAILGVLLHGVIKEVFFETPILYCTMLVLGGIVLLVVDRMTFSPRFRDAWTYPIGLCARIGLFQCLALVPGVSRSGATIVGALMMGTDKRSAAEFSFFLALPTMAGAFVYDLAKNWSQLSSADFLEIAVGFTVAFVTAVAVVKTLLDFVSRYGFAPFAWWRLIVGTAGLAWLILRT